MHQILQALISVAVKLITSCQMQVSFLYPSFAVRVIPHHHRSDDKETAVAEHSHMIWLKYVKLRQATKVLHRNSPTCHSGSITWGSFTLRLCIQAAVKHQISCLHKNYVQYFPFVPVTTIFVQSRLLPSTDLTSSLHFPSLAISFQSK